MLNCVTGLKYLWYVIMASYVEGFIDEIYIWQGVYHAAGVHA